MKIKQIINKLYKFTLQIYLHHNTSKTELLLLRKKVQINLEHYI